MEYVAGIQSGTASIINAFTQKELDGYTRTVIANSPYRDSLLDNAGIPLETQSLTTSVLQRQLNMSFF